MSPGAAFADVSTHQCRLDGTDDPDRQDRYPLFDSGNWKAKKQLKNGKLGTIWMNRLNFTLGPAAAQGAGGPRGEAMPPQTMKVG